MKIESSQVSAAAAHAQSAHRETRSETRFSFEGLMQAADAQIAASDSRAASANAAADEERRIRLMLQELVAAMLALLSGEKCRSETDAIAGSSGEGMPPAGSAVRRGAGASAGLAWQTVTVEHVEEHEATCYAAEGCVRTIDGREIGFRIDMAMRRDVDRTQVRETSGSVAFRDPLVINFAGSGTELAGKNFSFDLDADGLAERLPGLAGGSAFLAFDRDGDGRIADGRELFGATGEHAGDGFADLARLDADGNGWIDEADPAYAALGVWFPDGEIKPLAAAGVGALRTDGTPTPFLLADTLGQAQGRVWQTGLWLGEDGRAGTLQQVDFAVRQDSA